MSIFTTVNQPILEWTRNDAAFKAALSLSCERGLSLEQQLGPPQGDVWVKFVNQKQTKKKKKKKGTNKWNMPFHLVKRQLWSVEATSISPRPEVVSSSEFVGGHRLRGRGDSVDLPGQTGRSEPVVLLKGGQGRGSFLQQIPRAQAKCLIVSESLVRQAAPHSHLELNLEQNELNFEQEEPADESGDPGPCP